jgi:hypothetical protein
MRSAAVRQRSAALALAPRRRAAAAGGLARHVSRLADRAAPAGACVALSLSSPTALIMPSSSSRPASSASQRTPTPKSSAFAPRASATARKPTQYGRTTWSLSDPRSALWRGKMYIDGQFSWGMLEWWEQVLVGECAAARGHARRKGARRGEGLARHGGHG